MTYVILSYGVAGLGYGLLTLFLLLTRQSTGPEGQWLLAATAGASLWGLSVVWAVAATQQHTSAAIYAADAMRTLLWTSCLVATLPRDAGWQGSKRLLATAAAALAAATVLSAILLQRSQDAHLAMLGMAIIGCLAVEQIFRNSTAEQQTALKLFLFTVAFTFYYDIFVYSSAVLIGQLDVNLWAMRGVVASLAIPLFVLSAKRHPDWRQTLFISRHIVFYSTTLTAVGVYLIAVALVGAAIRQQDGAWSAALYFVYLAAALAILAIAVSSARLRAWARVFISKHFYRNRYEYRDEWLRLIRTLSSTEADSPLDQRGISALAAIINSPGGQLWLNKGPPHPGYSPFSAWRAPFPAASYPVQSPLVRFLSSRQWIIDTQELARNPERYDHELLREESGAPDDTVIVPLMHQRELLGFVRLIRPEGLRPLNYEDHDLLKTAGRQVAAFLAHDLAREQLSETRQFEAFNRLSAFMMHDLKNILAQQALLVQNAKKHQHRPEFVSDVIRTVDHGVQRMRRLLQQLQQQTPASPAQKIELNELVKRTVANCSDNSNISVVAEQNGIRVFAQPDQLGNVIMHVISNAQEATKEDGTIDIRVSERSGEAVVEIRDHGEGMSPEFVHRRLFKPFDSTKGSAGMGIGVYQAREIMRSLGGELTVDSRLGKGTTVRLSLPAARLPEDKRVSG